MKATLRFKYGSSTVRWGIIIIFKNCLISNHLLLICMEKYLLLNNKIKYKLTNKHFLP